MKIKIDLDLAKIHEHLREKAKALYPLKELKNIQFKISSSCSPEDIDQHIVLQAFFSYKNDEPRQGQGNKVVCFSAQNDIDLMTDIELEIKRVNNLPF